jgi:hypothetical protein
MHWCWRHPGVTALEVLWRWVFGSGALLLLFVYGRRIWMAATGGSGDPARLGLDSLTVTDPMSAASKLAGAWMLLWPMVWAVARWLVPLLVAVWVIVSGLGRIAVLRRVDPELRVGLGTMLVLQAMRALALLACAGAWIGLIRWASGMAVAAPLARGEDPNLLLYFATALGATLLAFVFWSTVSWVLAMAPLLAGIRGRGAVASVREATRIGPLRTKLVEINLVMGIVKIALLVLAMVLSACPVPFASVMTTELLVWWSAAVAVLYFIASDFFHVARTVAYLRLWRASEVPS